MVLLTWGCCLLQVYSVFATMFVQVFGLTKYGERLGPTAYFSTYGSAMLTCYQMITEVIQVTKPTYPANIPCWYWHIPCMCDVIIVIFVLWTGRMDDNYGWCKCSVAWVHPSFQLKIHLWLFWPPIHLWFSVLAVLLKSSFLLPWFKRRLQVTVGSTMLQFFSSFSR